MIGILGGMGTQAERRAHAGTPHRVRVCLHLCVCVRVCVVCACARARVRTHIGVRV